jgi:hypothetical protein
LPARWLLRAPKQCDHALCVCEATLLAQAVARVVICRDAQRLEDSKTEAQLSNALAAISGNGAPVKYSCARR